MKMSKAFLSSSSRIQEQLMSNELCIRVDRRDRIIGSLTKREAHLANGTNPPPLHRAFSVFLFDCESGRLLLQQRSQHKITFPGVWTNTCCSHPLHNIAQEQDGLAGVRRAARRKLTDELGLPASLFLKHEGLHFIRRIHYHALCENGCWGEHEIDYLLFARMPRDLIAASLRPNPEEVQAVKWLGLKELPDLLADKSVALSPWFRLIGDSLLPQAWSRFIDGTLDDNDDSDDNDDNILSLTPFAK